MTEQIPTPTPEQVQRWLDSFQNGPGKPRTTFEDLFLAACAAEWGANQELEACREEILDGPGRLYIGDCKLRIRLADDIWTARRPKPKSLAEEALEALDRMDQLPTAEDQGVIRRALERLQELEG